MAADKLRPVTVFIDIGTLSTVNDNSCKIVDNVDEIPEQPTITYLCGPGTGNTKNTLNSLDAWGRDNAYTVSYNYDGKGLDMVRFFRANPEEYTVSLSSRTHITITQSSGKVAKNDK